MVFINYLAVVATVLLAAASANTPCTGEDWESKTLEQRAMEAKWIAFIQVVTNEMPLMPSGNATATNTQVVVNISCWLKKGDESSMDDDEGAPPQTGDAPATGDDAADDDSDHHGGANDGNMTVPDAGQNITIILEKVNCKAHTLEKGKKYVLFMEKYNTEMNNETTMFKIVNVNQESGALTEPRDDVFQALHRGIDSGMTGKPDGECVDGVEIPCFEGDYDKEVCDGASSLVATMMATFAAAILATATL
ncbi:uncharacterized protein [Asterias amurensis]|uniref:uncharacterized protein n=1 Tax=Asterias amurensis TaxID=7602 RepID=UPI003AB1AE6D